jgi:hypothetical protein
VTYRNEGEALRARVDQLEDELAAAQDRIAKLSGEKTTETVARELRTSALLGASSGATLSKTLPYELDTEGYEAIAALVRERLKVEVSQVGHALTTPRDVFSLKREDGQTTIRLHGDGSGLAGSVVAAGAMTALFAGLPIVGVLHDVGMHAHDPVSSMLHAVWIVPTLVTGATWLARKRMQRTADRTLATHQGAFEAVLALAEKHAIRRDAPRARVAVEEEEPIEDEGAAQAAAKSPA